MNWKGISTLAMSIGLASGVQPALAQTAATDRPQAEGDADAHTGDIIVTANRREQRLQDVPATITAVTSQDIANLKLFRVEDVQSLSPGLQLDKGTSGFTSTVSLRGTGWDENSSTLPVVDFYINDVVSSPRLAFQAMYDVGQIEVLRGPQGTLRGRPSPAGAITIVTMRPDLLQAGGYASLTATTLDGMNGQGAVNIPLIEDRLAVRIAGLVDRTDANGVKSVNFAKDPFLETNAVRGSIRARPTDTLDIRFTYDHIENDFENYAQVVGLGMGYNGPAITSRDRLAVQERPTIARQNIEMASLQATWNLPFGGDLIYVGGYKQVDSYQQSTQDPGRAILGYSRDQRVYSTEKYWTHELRLQGTGALFDYVLGAYYNKGNGDTLVQADVPFSGAFGPPGSFTGPENPAYISNLSIAVPTRENSRAIFGNVTWHATDKLDIQGGLRYNVFKKSDFTVQTFTPARTIAFPIGIGAEPFCPFIPDPGSGTTPFIPSQVPGFCDLPLALPTITLPRRVTNKPFTYDASIKYAFTPDVNVYARFGHSFRQGSTNIGLQPGDNPILQALVFTDPETSNSYELGFKAALLDRRLRVNLAAFQQDYKNFLGTFTNINYFGTNGVATAGGGLTYNVDARIRGVEGEVSYRASENWDISLNASYATSKIKNELVPCTTTDIATLTAANPISFCRSNAAISSLPKFTATVQSEVRMPFGDNVAYLRGLANYRGKAFNPSSGFRTDDFLLLNLFAGVRIGDTADITLYGKNILNTKKELNRDPVAFSPVVGVDSGYRGTSFTQRREFGLSARFQFGSR